MPNTSFLRCYWQQRRGLRSHLIMLVLAALLPLMLFSVCMILAFAREERRTTERGMRETARALALAMDREVGEVQAALGILALSRPLAAGGLAGFYRQCLEALQFLPHDAWITPSDLQAVQDWVTEMQTPAATHGVTVQTAGLTTLGQVAFHAGTLRRAVLNLLQNALEAMSQGGMVTLEGQGMATHVQLQVRDTGSGIPAAHLAQIFEPLYTTKPEGTGLGLYIVQEIVAAHEGQLTVESVEGQGTTFTMTLPRVGGLIVSK